MAELSHPDFHWFVPIVRPKAADPDKQIEETGEALADVMTERRQQPLYGPLDGMALHTVASVRLLHRRAALTPVEGGRRVFVVGDADRLVPQESTPDAANALLKLLEEPPVGAFFILTAVDARRLLPTMRSRVSPLRLGALPDDEIRRFLAAEVRPSLAGTALDARVAAAGGSIGAALGANDDAAKARQNAEALVEAALGGPVSQLESALRQGAFAARGDFSAMLDALSDLLGDAARAASGRPPLRALPHVLAEGRDVEGLLTAIDRVADAREAAFGNVNPQLLLAVLEQELAEVL